MWFNHSEFPLVDRRIPLNGNKTKQAIMEEGESETKKIKLKQKTENILGALNEGNHSFLFSVFDIFFPTFSVFSITIDVCTDLTLGIQYSSQGYKSWAGATFLLIFFPSLIIQFFSLRWHIVDKTVSPMHWALHLCCLGIIHRYIKVIKAAIAVCKTKNLLDIQKIYLDQNDLCMLHLFESFLESAPQLVLQVYIITKLHEWRFWTVLSALASLLSLAWALASYSKAQRRARPNKNSVKWPGLLLQAIWRTGMLTSRISTLVLCAYCFGNYIFILILMHWLTMTIWIFYQKTDFCETYWEEKLYNAVIGVIYCFSFFNLQEGQSRWRALAFYLIIIFQNLTCLTLFLMMFGDKNAKMAVSSFIAIVGGTILGSASMLLYYRFFHPSGPIKFFAATDSTPNQNPDTPYPTWTLKRKRDEKHKSSVKTMSESALKSTLADSIVIVEEKVMDKRDPDIKIFLNWINEDTDNRVKPATEKNEKEAYKRRAICSSVDLIKMLESETEPDRGSAKLMSNETFSEILSAHDYENLCAVNIARETWGLRSWRGYSDIETSLHDDSVVYDRRLDTLTSTTSSDRSGNTFQKESDRIEKEDYIDAIAEDLARCDSETSSDLGQSSIDFFPVYPLGTLDPIFEETEESSNASTEYNDLKIKNGSVSTLVATIDEIRRNTPIQNRYRPDSFCNKFGLLGSAKQRSKGNWKKVKFASKLLIYLGNEAENMLFEADETKNIGGVLQNNIGEIDFPPTVDVNHKLENSNKENIPTIIPIISKGIYRKNTPERSAKVREEN